MTMLKLCGHSVIKQLSLLVNNCLRDGVFPKYWQKVNVIPAHKKGNKQLVSKYDPVFVLKFAKNWYLNVFMIF